MAALTIPRALALLGAAMSLVAVAAAGQRLPGLGYSPFGPVPFCLPDAQVQSDVQRLGRVSQRVRIYGVQCNNTHAVLAMAQSLGLQVLLGVWLSTDTAANEIELQAMESVLARWGSQAQGLLTAVAVGNEVLGVNGGTLPALLNYLDRARAVVQKHAPQTPLTYVDIPEVWLGTHGTMTVKGQGLPPAPARAGMLPCPAGASAAVCALLRRVDVAGVNIHPYHAGLPPTCAGLGIKGCYDGPTWVLGRMAALRKALNTSQVLLAEVGWPSAGEACCSGAPAGFPSNATFLAVPSAQSSAAHLATFVATAAAAGESTYFYFTMFDDEWKRVHAPCTCPINPYLAGCNNTPLATTPCTFDYSWGLLTSTRQAKAGLDLSAYVTGPLTDTGAGNGTSQLQDGNGAAVPLPSLGVWVVALFSALGAVLMGSGVALL